MNKMSIVVRQERKTKDLRIIAKLERLYAFQEATNEPHNMCKKEKIRRSKDTKKGAIINKILLSKFDASLLKPVLPQVPPTATN